MVGEHPERGIPERMKQTNAPLVSVVCLCYNHETTVAQAIESVLAQKTDFPFELIVHDDASTDATAEIIRGYHKKYPDVIVPVLQETNRYRTCNLAETYIAPLLRGRFVAICEGDDYWTSPDKLAKQVLAMQNDPGIAMCFHAVEEVLPNGEARPFRPLKQTGPADPGQIVRRGGMFCPTVSLTVRRDIADLWPDFRRAADVYDYPLQVLAANEGKVWYIDESLAAYRFQHGNSWTALRSGETDFTHIKNETEWLAQFSAYSGHRFDREIDYHLTHLWFTEYRKAPSKEKRKKIKEYARRLGAKDRLTFGSLTLMFRLLGKRAEPVYSFIKKKLLQ